MNWLNNYFRKLKEGNRDTWMVTSIVLMIAGAIVWGAHRQSQKGGKPQENKVQESAGASENALKTDIKTSVTGIAPLETIAPPKTPPPAPPPVVTSGGQQAEAPVYLYVSKKPQLSTATAPFGTVVRAKLIFTVDSSRITTPIVGMILEDVYSDTGDLVLPAGGYVHGSAQLDRSRDRIAGQNNWVLVFRRQSDRREVELPVTGIALDHAPDYASGGWRITDGSAGLKGDVIKFDNLAEVKLFVANFLGGFAQGFQEQQTVITGSGLVNVSEGGTLKEALSTAVAQSMQQQAAQIAAKLQQDGVYVRAPAGKEFYVYFTQPIDASRAEIGGSIRNNQQNPNNP